MRDRGCACQILRDMVIRSMSGRYASYWNAFLFCYAPVFFCNALNALNVWAYNKNLWRMTKKLVPITCKVP